jgi:hypothetical protein
MIINLLSSHCPGNITMNATGTNTTRIGEPFYIRSAITDACGDRLSNYTCTADTGVGFWGIVSMPYQTSTKDYLYSLLQSNKVGVVNWQVVCT